MRHQVSGFKLNRNASNRKALLRQMTQQVITHRGIITTATKAKYLQPHLDRCIKHAQSANLADRRKLISTINDPKLVDKLIHDIGAGYTTRQSGFSRIIPLKRRRGDNTLIVRLELMPKDPKTTTESTSASQKTESKKTDAKKADSKKTNATKKATTTKKSDKVKTTKKTNTSATKEKAKK